MPQPLILVTGANGRTGRAVIAELRSGDVPVRALIRQPNQAAGVQALGAAETVLGDLDDETLVDAAVAGSTAVVHIGPPMHPNEVSQTSRILAAARRHGVAHLVYYSVMHPLRREVRHHRLKLDAEEKVIEGGVPYTILQPIRYMQHLEPIWNEVRKTGIHAMPYNVDIGFTAVDLADLAKAVARVVRNPRHFHATYELAGPETLSQRGMARILSEELGREVIARAIPLDEMAEAARRRGVPEDRIAQMRVMNDHYDRFGFLGNPNVLTWIIGQPPGTFRNYVRRLLSAG